MSELKTHTSIKVIILVVVITVVILLFTQLLKNPNSDETNNSSTVHRSGDENNKPAIETLWQWQKIQKLPKEQTATARAELLPFTAESVYNALQAVKVDEDGNIILDHDALVSLDEALERIYNRLDPDSLSALQKLIKEALPGKTGEQTAKLVADYQRFLQAKDEFSRINESLVNTSGETTLVSITNDEELYGELQSLREVYMGKEATNSLFRISDANANFMFDSMKLEYDDSLSSEEKEKKRKDIQAKHLEDSINIDNWPERYKAFNSAKELIVNSSIEQEDMQRQLSDLLTQHFDSDELKRIKHIGLDQP